MFFLGYIYVPKTPGIYLFYFIWFFNFVAGLKQNLVKYWFYVSKIFKKII